MNYDSEFGVYDRGFAYYYCIALVSKILPWNFLLTFGFLKLVVKG